MQIYSKRGELNKEQKEKFADILARELVFGVRESSKKRILDTFNLSDKTYDFVINKLCRIIVPVSGTKKLFTGYEEFQKVMNIVLKNKLLKTDDNDDVISCWKNSTLPALYADNKELFKEHIEEIKKKFLASLFPIHQI